MNSEKLKLKNLSCKTSVCVSLRYLFFAIALFIIPCSLFVAVSAQNRDYLTDEEVELIRDAQQIDMRIDVLTHAIDRRFQVLKINANEVPMPKKDQRDWGKLPEGTRVELLGDIKHILQKAIDDIDNLSERPDSMLIEDDEDKEKDKKHPRTFANLFPKAVKALAAAADRYERVLKAELDKTIDNHEKGVILDSLEMCDEIKASVAKLKT